MKKKYNLLIALLCCSLLFTGCSFSIKLGNSSKNDTETNVKSNTDTNEPISESNSNTSNSNTTDSSNSNTSNNSATTKLKCSKDYSSTMSNGIKMTQDVDMDFKDDKIENIVMDMIFELPSTLSGQSAVYIDALKKQYDNSYGKYNGVNITVNKKSDTSFIIKIAMNYKNISSEDKTAMGFVGSESYSINKTAFEQQGYTCK